MSLLLKALLHRPDKRLLTQFKPPVLPPITHQQCCTLDATQYQQFCQLTDWDNMDIVHPCFLQAVSLPMHMACLSHKRSPFPLLGLIHRSNRIQQFGPLDIQAPFHFSVGFEGITAHKLGWDIHMYTRVMQAEVPCYEASSTYLVRARAPHTGGKIPRKEHGKTFQDESLSEKYVFKAALSAPSNMGRRYAKVSKDANPIHLYAATARLFGFPQAIAHGMWTLSYCVSQFEVADRVKHISVQCDFKKPLLLPGNAKLLAYEENGETHFSLINDEGGSAHINGSLAQG
ncbi:MaoC/PaaZ C-terminal domain-containing protein [Alteromonas sp. 14N.309.X.WAT.G.H12]|uniref:MaoC/PaaZ C-terminal domain-containing protein n=1 Tax=Alteromonas sp. 14N.309.X.WAT.G.H12 TaxID=3120824 RepID=UPI002FD33E6A